VVVGKATIYSGEQRFNLPVNQQVLACDRRFVLAPLSPLRLCDTHGAAGPFTVHSHTHPLKFTRGYFQFSFFSNEQAPVPANTVTHLPKFGDETYQFQFLSDAAARY
jgi:hypothetical protein